MGIKFHCPNGHKLHVKSFLAGKKGVCPECGIRLRIPLTSEPKRQRNAGANNVEQPGPESANLGDEEQDVSLPMENAPTTAAVMMSSVAAATEARPAVPVGAATSLPATAVVVPNVASSAAPTGAIPSGIAYTPPLGAPAQPFGGATAVAPVRAVSVNPTGIPLGQAAPASYPAAAYPAAANPQPRVAPMGYGSAPMSASPIAAPSVPDPIAESPLAAWYVRPPSGGQYGPARGDVMRKWIGEGRVSADSLVWREGWGDWLGASIVFPSLKGPTAPVETAAAAAPFIATSPTATTTNAIKKPLRRGPSPTAAVAFIVLLALLAVGLLIALFFILNNSQNSTKKKTTSLRTVLLSRDVPLLCAAGCVDRPRIF